MISWRCNSYPLHSSEIYKVQREHLLNLQQIVKSSPSTKFHKNRLHRYRDIGWQSGTHYNNRYTDKLADTQWSRKRYEFWRTTHLEWDNVYSSRWSSYSLIAVARVTVWETAVPPNFICLCVLLIVPTLAMLVSSNQRSCYLLAYDALCQVNIGCACFTTSTLICNNVCQVESRWHNH